MSTDAKEEADAPKKAPKPPTGYTIPERDNSELWCRRMFQQSSAKDDSVYGCDYMTKFEVEVCRIHDDIRSNPLKYAEILEKEWLPDYDEKSSSILMPSNDWLMKEGRPLLLETIKFLKTQAKSFKPKHAHLEFNKALSYGPLMHAIWGGRVAAEGHVSPSIVPDDKRLQEIIDGMKAQEMTTKDDPSLASKLQINPKHKGEAIITKIEMTTKKNEVSGPDQRVSFFAGKNVSVFENVAIGATTPLEVVLGLVIDDGVADRGHRKTIFTPSLKYIGVGAAHHWFNGNLTAINYSDTPIPLAADIDTKLAHRRVRIPKGKFPKNADIHDVLQERECEMCHGIAFGPNPKSLQFCQTRDATEEDYKNPHLARLIEKHAKNTSTKVTADSMTAKQAEKPQVPLFRHKECDLCPTCGETMNLDHKTSTSYIDRDTGRRERCHRACIAKEFDLWCYTCGCDIFLHEGSATVVDELTVRTLGDQIQEKRDANKKNDKFNGRKEAILQKDRICSDCIDPMWASYKKKMNESTAKAKEEMEKYEAEKKERRTCAVCKQHIDKEKDGVPMFFEDKYYHKKCFNNMDMGTSCGCCLKPIKRFDVTCEMEDMTFHDGCADEWLANGKKPKGAAGGSGLNAVKELSPSAKAKQEEEIAKQCDPCGFCKQPMLPEQRQLQDAKYGWIHETCFEKASEVPCEHCGKLTTLNGKEGGGRVALPNQTKYVHKECMSAYFANGIPAAAAIPGDTSTVTQTQIAPKMCDMCKKEIEMGKVVFFENGQYHRECCNKKIAEMQSASTAQQQQTKPNGADLSCDAKCHYCGEAITSVVDKCTMDDLPFHNEKGCVKAFLSNGMKPKGAGGSAAKPANTASTTTTSTVVSSSSSPVCNYCNKEIVGEPALRADDKLWHTACRNKSQEVPCDYCGEMITDIYSRSEVPGDGMFHSDCVGPYFSNGRKKKA